MEGSQALITLNSLASFFQGGGVFMYIILGSWGIGIAIALERYRKLKTTYDIDGPSFMNEIQRYVLSNDTQGAIRVCSGTTAALGKVLKSGLKRSSQSTDQIQNYLVNKKLAHFCKILHLEPHAGGDQQLNPPQHQQIL